MISKYKISEGPLEEEKKQNIPLDVWAETNKDSPYLPFHLHPFSKYKYSIAEIVCPIESIIKDDNWKERDIPFFIKDVPSPHDVYEAGGSLKPYLLPYMERAQIIRPGISLNTPNELSKLDLIKEGWSLFIRKRGNAIRVLGALERLKKCENHERNCIINKDVFFRSIPYFEEKKEILHRLHVMHGLSPTSEKGEVIPIIIRRKLLDVDPKTIAKTLGISEYHYKLLEKGEKKPTLTIIIKMAKIYNVSPDVILQEFKYDITYSNKELDHLAFASMENKE